MKKAMMTLLGFVLAMGMQAQTNRVLQEDDTIVGKKEVKLHKEAFYKIRESDNIENSHNYVLREVAEFMQKYSDTKVTLTGYADRGTGNPRLNVMYALNRATKFKNDLVSRYGIDPNRIVADSKGDAVQPFADNDKNRCVIVDGTGFELIIGKKKKADDMADLLRLKAQREKDSLYLAEMARQAAQNRRVDTIVIHHTDTVLVNPYGDCNKPERPFGLNKCNRWKNWFITAGVGPAIYQGDHNREAKYMDRIFPDVNLAVGKWIFPALGFRAGVNLDFVRMYYNGAPTYHYDGNYAERPWLNKMRFNTWNFHIDALFNLSSFIWRPYQKRIYSCIPYFGIGRIATWDDQFQYSLSINAGILNSIRLSENFDLNIDLRVKSFKDELNWFTQGKERDGMGFITIGATWHFTERGF